MTQKAQRCVVAAAIGLVTFLGFGRGDAVARLIEVADCSGGGATQERSARYVLAHDVDCAGEPEPILWLPRGSVLQLGGYTLSNGDVVCSGKCQIRGPGTIRGGGIIGDDKVTVVRTIITGSPSNGVLATNAKGRARAWILDSVISGNAMTGVEADRMTHIFRSTISDNGRYGVAVSLQPFNDCARGRIRTWGSEISGNGVDATCGVDEMCADVATCAQGGNDRPVLHRTPCGTSYELGSGMPGRSCSICTLD
jgi:hypothetical protein